MYQFESRVRYSEVDSERHLTLPAVMDYLQDCCTFQSEDMDIGVEYLAEQKQAWVLSFWEIKIRRYPVMGEKICVETWPYAFKGFYGYRNFRITNGQGEELVLANSVWVYMDMDRRSEKNCRASGARESFRFRRAGLRCRRFRWRDFLLTPTTT